MFNFAKHCTTSVSAITLHNLNIYEALQILWDSLFLNSYFGFLNVFALLLMIGHLQTSIDSSEILLYIDEAKALMELLPLFVVVFLQQLLFVTTLISLEEMYIFDANINCSLLPSRSAPFCRHLVLCNIVS